MGYGVAQERQEALTWCHKEPLVWNSRSEHTVCSLPLCSGITAWNRPHCFGTAAPAVATKDGGATRQEMIHLRPFWGMISTTETHSTAQGWSWSARRQQLGGLVSWHWVSGSILVCPWYLSSPLTLWLPLLTPWALQGPGKPDACRKDEVGGCWRGGGRERKGKSSSSWGCHGCKLLAAKWDLRGSLWHNECWQDRLLVCSFAYRCAHTSFTFYSVGPAWRPRDTQRVQLNPVSEAAKHLHTGEVACCVWKKNLRKRDGINTNKAQDSVQSRFLIASVGSVSSPSPVTLDAGDRKARRKHWVIIGPSCRNHISPVKNWFTHQVLAMSVSLLVVLWAPWLKEQQRLIPLANSNLLFKVVCFTVCVCCMVFVSKTWRF